MKYVFAAIFTASLTAWAAKTAAQEIASSELIKNNIDVHAQYSLARMSKNTARTGDANAIYQAIVQGTLGGIYIVNQQVPALRAQKVGKGWWNLIPSGMDAMCFKEPTDQTPLIVFRDEIRSNSEKVDNALLSAWDACGLNVRTFTVKVTYQDTAGKTVSSTKNAVTLKIQGITDSSILKTCRITGPGSCDMTLPNGEYVVWMTSAPKGWLPINYSKNVEVSPTQNSVTMSIRERYQTTAVSGGYSKAK